jgi:hypothetical protein
MNCASKPESLASQQQAFAAHIRDPAAVPPPAGVEERRMKVYRELFFSNISKLLAGNFPVVRRLYGDPGWARLVREFYVEHRAQTPLFTELPREFLGYLEQQRQGRAGDPPFLLELAHYEWVELALALDPRDLETVQATAAGDLLNGIPVLSPLAWPLSYRYPVHRITPEFQPQEPPAEMTHLLVYRTRADMVKFMELNEVTRLLLALMQEQPGLTGRQLLQRVTVQIGHHSPAVVTEKGAALMRELRARDVLLGTLPRP